MGSIKKTTLTWIKEAVWGKVEDWKEKLLNQVGKEILIKVVIQAIPSYGLSILLFLKVSVISCVLK